MAFRQQIHSLFLVLLVALLLPARGLGQFVPIQERTAELSGVLEPEWVTVHERSSVDLFWTFTNTNVAWNLSAADSVILQYAPTNGAWQQVVTGSVANASAGRVKIPLRPAELSTNGVFAFDIEVSSNGVDIVKHPYGWLTIEPELFGGSSTSQFPTTGAVIDLAGKTFTGQPWEDPIDFVNGGTTGTTGIFVRVGNTVTATFPNPTASGDLTSITNNAGSVITITGGDTGDVGLGLTEARLAQGVSNVWPNLDIDSTDDVTLAQVTNTATYVYTNNANGYQTAAQVAASTNANLAAARAYTDGATNGLLSAEADTFATVGARGSTYTGSVALVTGGVGGLAVGAATASGNESLAAGNFLTSASGLNSIALGSAAAAPGDYSAALGSSTSAQGHRSTAIGFNGFATGTNSIIINASGNNVGSTANGRLALSALESIYIIGADIKANSNALLKADLSSYAGDNITWDATDYQFDAAAGGGGGASPQRPAIVWRGSDLTPLVQDAATGWRYDALDAGGLQYGGYGYRSVSNLVQTDTFTVHWQVPPDWTSWTSNSILYWADSTALTNIVAVYGVLENAIGVPTNQSAALITVTQSPTAANTVEAMWFPAGSFSSTNYDGFTATITAQTIRTNATWWIDGRVHP